jgi:hypothetical protein
MTGEKTGYGAWKHGARRVAALVAFVVLPAASPGQITTSEQAGAIVVFPRIRLDRARGVDTLVRIGNTAANPVVAHCFYVNENGHCSNDGSVCLVHEDCVGGTCIPGSTEVDFIVRITPSQPLAWLAGDGLASNEFPLDGILRVGPGGASNAGSRVPPVPEDPFVGWLQCVAVDSSLLPVEQTSLMGDAVLYEQTANGIDTAEYGAVGIQALAGASDGNTTLLIGSEYSGCPNFAIFNHFFDGAVDPASAERSIDTTLALVPCSVDFLRQISSDPGIDYLIFNEFAQQFSLHGVRTGTLLGSLSRIDGQQRETSPFFVGVAGTLTGKTRLRSVGSGVLGVVIEERSDLADPSRKSRAAFNLHAQGTRPAVDTIVLP